MSAAYREATTRDLDRERALYMLAGATVAIAAVLCWPIADVLVALIVDRLVGSGDTLPRDSGGTPFVSPSRSVSRASGDTSTARDDLRNAAIDLSTVTYRG